MKGQRSNRRRRGKETISRTIVVGAGKGGEALE
jgi:hypothetical protein